MAIGVREAARRAATNLPPLEANRFVKRALKRSEREGWVKQKQAALSKPLTEQQAKPVSSNVVNGSDLLLSKLKADGDTTKTSLSEAAKNAAIAFSKKKGNAVISKAKQLRDITATASQIHGWDNQHSGGSVSVNILTNQAAVQVVEK
jgi:hypothetical protein